MKIKNHRKRHAPSDGCFIGLDFLVFSSSSVPFS